MISEQAQKKLMSINAMDFKDFSYYKSGFEDGYQFAKSEAAAEIEKRYNDGFGEGWKNAIPPWQAKITTLEAIIAKLENALEFYSDPNSWNPIEEGNAMPEPVIDECDMERHKPFYFNIGGKTARSTLQDVQAMKEKLK